MSRNTALWRQFWRFWGSRSLSRVCASGLRRSFDGWARRKQRSTTCRSRRSIFTRLAPWMRLWTLWARASDSRRSASRSSLARRSMWAEGQSRRHTECSQCRLLPRRNCLGASRRIQVPCFGNWIRRLAPKQFRRGRSRHWEHSVCRLDCPSAHIERRASELLDAERLESDARAHNVHNRIHGANLVKMDLLERHVVDLCFRLAQPSKDRRSPLAHTRDKLRLPQNLQNCRQRAVFLLILRGYARVGGRHSVLPNFYGSDLPARYVQSEQFLAQMIRRASGVHQRAKNHVPANPRKTIKVRKFHGVARKHKARG